MKKKTATRDANPVSAKRTVAEQTSPTPSYPHPVTLAIDIGGSGLKVMALDVNGKPLTERLRTPTPNPATPERMLAVMEELRQQMPPCDRASVGFPGVIKHGKTMTAANLNPRWIGFPLESTLQRHWNMPVRLANDAAVQGYGAIRGRGVEMVLTVGTGLGSALFTNGHLCPGLELGHHPWRKGKTYEDYLGRRGLERLGKRKWNRKLAKAIDQTAHTFNWDHLYIGGGNAKLIDFKLPGHVTIISNEDGLFGGVALWRYQD